MLRHQASEASDDVKGSAPSEPPEGAKRPQARAQLHCEGQAKPTMAQTEARTRGHKLGQGAGVAGNKVEQLGAAAHMYVVNHSSGEACSSM